ncbi:hypothetical protein R6Z07M_010952 [Ovis aries]
MQGGGEFSGTAADAGGDVAEGVSSGLHLVEAFTATLRVPGPQKPQVLQQPGVCPDAALETASGACLDAKSGGHAQPSWWALGPNGERSFAEKDNSSGLELGIRERGSMGRCTERALVPKLPCPPCPFRWGPGRRAGWCERRRLSSFQIGKPAAAVPQDEAGRSRAACAVSHPGRSRRLIGMRPGQSPGSGWAAGRRGNCGLERLPVTKQDPPCGSLLDPQRLAAPLQGRGGHAPLDTARGSPPLLPPGKRVR